MKKINFNEEFNLNGNIYIFSEKEGAIALKKVRESKSKPSFVPPTLEEVKNYFKEKGYTEQSAIKAFEYYDVANWKDGRGQQVLNWKQKCLSNWMKPENLIQTNKSSMVR